MNLDAELNILLRNILVCNTSDELKTLLVDIQNYQNEKPFEIVGTQKALYLCIYSYIYSVQMYFQELIDKKSHLITDSLSSFMNQILENFESYEDSLDVSTVSEMDAREVDISTVVRIGDMLGRGNYGVVRKGQLVATNELVAVKIIQKAELKPRDIECIKVCVHLLSDQ